MRRWGGGIRGGRRCRRLPRQRIVRRQARLAALRRRAHIALRGAKRKRAERRKATLLEGKAAPKNGLRSSGYRTRNSVTAWRSALHCKVYSYSSVEALAPICGRFQIRGGAQHNATCHLLRALHDARRVHCFAAEWEHVLTSVASPRTAANPSSTRLAVRFHSCPAQPLGPHLCRRFRGRLCRAPFLHPTHPSPRLPLLRALRVRHGGR